jgi:hypothetical protein
MFVHVPRLCRKSCLEGRPVVGIDNPAGAKWRSRRGRRPTDPMYQSYPPALHRIYSITHSWASTILLELKFNPLEWIPACIQDRIVRRWQYRSRPWRKPKRNSYIKFVIVEPNGIPVLFSFLWIDQLICPQCGH